MPRQHSCRGVGNNGSMLWGMEPWPVVLLHRKANKATKPSMILIQINLTNAYSSIRYQSVAAIVKLPWTLLSVVFPVTLALLSHGHGNWPNLQISEWTSSISHDVAFRAEMCTFLFWMNWACWDMEQVHSGIWEIDLLVPGGWVTLSMVFEVMHQNISHKICTCLFCSVCFLLYIDYIASHGWPPWLIIHSIWGRLIVNVILPQKRNKHKPRV